MAVQGVFVLGLLVAPMLRPLALPAVKVAAPPVLVNLRKPEVKVEPVRTRTAAANDSALRVPVTQVAPVIERLPGGHISDTSAGSDTTPLVAMGTGMGSGFGSGVGLGSGFAEPAAPTVRVRSAVPLRISSGVSSGLLLAPMRPVYPALARAAHVEGAVVISARIDKDGRIVGLQVVSGPEMLRSAAVEAVSAARYRPYRLNGEAVEVETTIAVNFRIGG